jgi:hypothetical protein
MNEYTYQEIKSNLSTIIFRSDKACIPTDPDNTDYQAYLKFLAEGGQPLPADSE